MWRRGAARHYCAPASNGQYNGLEVPLLLDSCATWSSSQYCKVRHWFSPIGRCEVCGSSSKRTALRKPGRGTHFYRRCCEVSIKGPALCEMWCCYCDFSRKVIRLALDTAEFQGIPACKGKEDDGGQDSSLHRHPIL
ncbi:uncharacterized protein LOC144111127 isoform X2 [Amblyomma americanum]